MQKMNIYIIYIYMHSPIYNNFEDIIETQRFKVSASEQNIFTKLQAGDAR